MIQVRRAPRTFWDCLTQWSFEEGLEQMMGSTELSWLCCGWGSARTDAHLPECPLLVGEWRLVGKAPFCLADSAPLYGRKVGLHCIQTFRFAVVCCTVSYSQEHIPSIHLQAVC